jgi:methylmalonyl-CoA/ethylmalonyl-CoA epimerase
MLEVGKGMLSNVAHYGYVVGDVQKSVEFYWTRFEIGPWALYDYGEGEILTYHGEREEMRYKLAFSEFGGKQIELMQPISGRSCHMDFLKKHGNGMHHVGVMVDNLKECADYLRSLGLKELHGMYYLGLKKDGAAYYFDTTEVLGTIIEICQPISEVPPPKEYYPAPKK